MRANVPTPTSAAAAQLLRTRIGKICVAIIGSTAAEMIEKANAVVKETPFLEFRLDYLEKPLTALPKLKQFFADNTAATGIATCRRAANGGKFAGPLAAEMEILTKAAGSGFHLLDLELESAESLKRVSSRSSATPASPLSLVITTSPPPRILTRSTSASRPSSPTSSRSSLPPRPSPTMSPSCASSSG